MFARGVEERDGVETFAIWGDFMLFCSHKFGLWLNVKRTKRLTKYITKNNVCVFVCVVFVCTQALPASKSSTS